MNYFNEKIKNKLAATSGQLLAFYKKRVGHLQGVRLLIVLSIMI
jgi:hypothetical protein